MSWKIFMHDANHDVFVGLSVSTYELIAWSTVRCLGSMSRRDWNERDAESVWTNVVLSVRALHVAAIDNDGPSEWLPVRQHWTKETETSSTCGYLPPALRALQLEPQLQALTHYQVHLLSLYPSPQFSNQVSTNSPNDLQEHRRPRGYGKVASLFSLLWE
jgi:hypothetical protein